LNNRQNFCLNWQAVGVTRPGGMAQVVCVPEKSAFSIGNLPFEQGAWMEPLSCVLHGMERLQLELASNVVVLGAGPIGNLLAQVARLQGASRITAVDKNVSRARLAVESGADACFYSLDELPLDAYDAVIDATGSLPVLKRSLAFVRCGGKILWFGVPPAGQEVSIEPFVIFRKGLTVLSSFTSVRNSYQALDLLLSGKVDVSRLVSHQLPLAEFHRGIEMIEQGQENVMKVLICPND
jgi:threonine dehydrogenase-like Zn-dependent dehydrogenase